jgi:hypothetical protein
MVSCMPRALSIQSGERASHTQRDRGVFPIQAEFRECAQDAPMLASGRDTEVPNFEDVQVFSGSEHKKRARHFVVVLVSV